MWLMDNANKNNAQWLNNNNKNDVCVFRRTMLGKMCVAKNNLTSKQEKHVQTDEEMMMK